MNPLYLSLHKRKEMFLGFSYSYCQTSNLLSLTLILNILLLLYKFPCNGAKGGRIVVKLYVAYNVEKLIVQGGLGTAMTLGKFHGYGLHARGRLEVGHLLEQEIEEGYIYFFLSGEVVYCGEQ